MQGSEPTDPLCLVNILSWTTHTSPLCVTLLNSPLLLLSLGGMMGVPRLYPLAWPCTDCDLKCCWCFLAATLESSCRGWRHPRECSLAPLTSNKLLFGLIHSFLVLWGFSAGLCVLQLIPGNHILICSLREAKKGCLLMNMFMWTH